MRARGHVDPDLHYASRASIRADRSVGGSCSTCRSYQSVNASRPQSWRLQSCAPATCSSSSRVHRLRLEEALRAQRLRRQRRARERLELAAQPGGGGNREAALAPVHDLARHERRGRLAKQHLLREPAHLVPRRQREREVRHDGVEERNARLERVRHRRAVGLHEQVVDEVDAEVDVLQARERFGALRSRRSARGRRRPDRTRCACRAARRAGPARRSPSSRDGARAAAAARRGRSASPCSRSSPSRVERREPLDERAREARERRHPIGEQVGRVGVVAAEELVAAFAGERDLHVLAQRAARRDTSAAPTSRRTARRTPRRARAAAGSGPGWTSSS